MRKSEAKEKEMKNMWNCKVCGFKCFDADDYCRFCGVDKGINNQRYDTQVDDIDGWE